MRVHEKIRAAFDRSRREFPEPLIVGRGINDVAIVVLTLSAKPDKAGEWTDNGLYQVAEELQHELAKVDGVGETYVVGGSPQRDSGRARSREARALRRHARPGHRQACKCQPRLPRRRFPRGGRRRSGRRGQTLQGVPDIGLLLLTTRDGRPVYVKDVADVVVARQKPSIAPGR